MNTAEHPSDLPRGLVQSLREEWGGELRFDDLGGMSVARVWRVESARGVAVAKVSGREAESRFYERVAPGLPGVGVAVPWVFATGHEGDLHWTVMEWLPGRFVAPDREAWEPHPQVVATLARLHRATREQGVDFEFGRKQPWGAEDTTRVLPLFDAGVRAALGAALDRMAAANAGRGHTQWCWISGDASPPNWGWRESGELVLFDWELFRPGTPAEYLAPAVPGLAPAESFRLMARAYLAECGAIGWALPWDEQSLARETVVAKAATVVALLGETLDGSARVPADYRAEVVRAFPGWLAEMGREFGFGA